MQITYQKKDGSVMQRFRNTILPYKIGDTTSMGWKVLNNVARYIVVSTSCFFEKNNKKNKKSVDYINDYAIIVIVKGSRIYLYFSLEKLT